ncbi:MAG: hypothetical protein ACLFO5_02670 [Opitutales bacterium]
MDLRNFLAIKGTSVDFHFHSNFRKIVQHQTINAMINMITKMHKQPVSLRLLAAIGIMLAGASLSLAQAQDTQGQQGGQQGGQQEGQSEVTELQQELQSVNSEIEEARVEAAKSSDVQDNLMKYNETLSEKMKEIDSDKEEDIERRSELFKKIVDTPDSDEMSQEEIEEARELNQEFSKVRQGLMEVESQANQSEDVQNALAEYNESIEKVMKESDPEVKEKLEKRDELRQKMQKKQESMQQ